MLDISKLPPMAGLPGPFDLPGSVPSTPPIVGNSSGSGSSALPQILTAIPGIGGILGNLFGGGSSSGQKSGPGAYPVLPSIIPNAAEFAQCPEFALTNPLPAIGCYAEIIAEYVAVNGIVILVFVFGLYLLFKPSIQTIVERVKSAGAKAAEAAEISEAA